MSLRFLFLDVQGDKGLFRLFLILFFIFSFTLSEAQHSVARKWNEVLLQSIREDFARPTVHSRNLFHTSVAMYDSWAAYDDIATTYFLGNNVGGFSCYFSGVPRPANIKAAREEAISYAAYRVLKHRFEHSPNAVITLNRIDSLFTALGFDSSIESVDYETGEPAALGNYIGYKVIEFGMQDGANEAGDYQNQYYEPVNPPIAPAFSGNPNILNPNRWQAITLDEFFDQSGNSIPGNTQPFLGPEWGKVIPFALKSVDMVSYQRDDFEYKVYHDPGSPPHIMADGTGLSAEYQWGFTLVAKWSAQLDPGDNVMIDISPASLGNIQDYPTTIAGLRTFYNEEDGGDPGKGYAINPETNLPYTPQLVPRGDYTRVLAEFWADGPDSETPPGHWFTILNYVNDHPEFEKRYQGEGPILDEMEWDVKAYLTLGGAMHDAAVTSWGIKGWYDYLRPISAIRYMAANGQSSNPGGPDYSPDGIPLTPGLIEVVETGDPLSGFNDINVGKIKLYCWRGPDYIFEPEFDIAGTGWILAEDWWPYQRPSFVTPPFAGYISGHSTFSRAAAEVLTKLTGDAYFPGGIGEFVAEANKFLVFEDGPSVDVTLQWATYRDASDQTSLSRIWGGIHPPADDIPGRLIGEKIGIDAFNYADQYFNGLITSIDDKIEPHHQVQIYPNPIKGGEIANIIIQSGNPVIGYEVLGILGEKIIEYKGSGNYKYELNTANFKPGVYLLNIKVKKGILKKKLVIK